jgi:hypothetical protein
MKPCTRRFNIVLRLTLIATRPLYNSFAFLRTAFGVMLFIHCSSEILRIAYYITLYLPSF